MAGPKILFAEPQDSGTLPRRIRSFLNKKGRSLAETRILITDLAFSRDEESPRFAHWLAKNCPHFRYIDHHPHQSWPIFAGDSRFFLVPRTRAPGCPEMVEAGEGKAYHILITHIDFDGLMSAAKGLGFCYPELDQDARIFDNRLALSPSPIGLAVEEAIKGLEFHRLDLAIHVRSPRLQKLREGLFAELCGFIQTQNPGPLMNQYTRRYAEAEQLGRYHYENVRHHPSGLIVAREEERPFDRPKWFSRLSREHADWCGIIMVPMKREGEKFMLVSSTRPDRDNFPQLFGQKGGMATVTAVPRTLGTLRTLLSYCRGLIKNRKKRE